MATFAQVVLAALGVVLYEVFGQIFPSASPLAVAACAFLTTVGIAGGVVFIVGSASTSAAHSEALRRGRQRLADESLQRSVRAFFLHNPRYARTLRKVRDRSVYRDEFGDWVVTPWLDELTAFITAKMSGVFPGRLDQQTAVGFLDVVHRGLAEVWAVDPATATDGVEVAPDPNGRDGFGETRAAMFRGSEVEVMLAGRSGDRRAAPRGASGELCYAVRYKQYSTTVEHGSLYQAAALHSPSDPQSEVVTTNQRLGGSARRLACAHVMPIESDDLPDSVARVTPAPDAIWIQRYLASN